MSLRSWFTVTPTHSCWRSVVTTCTHHYDNVYVICWFLSSDEYPTIMWTGYGKKTPVLVFKSDAIVSKKSEFRAIGGLCSFPFLILRFRVFWDVFFINLLPIWTSTTTVDFTVPVIHLISTLISEKFHLSFKLSVKGSCKLLHELMSRHGFREVRANRCHIVVLNMLPCGQGA